MDRTRRILNKIKEISQITWVGTLLMGIGVMGSFSLIIGFIVWINPAIIFAILIGAMLLLLCFAVGLLIRMWRDEDPV